MASRILHLAVAEEMMKQINIQDKNRFRLGCILPDAYHPEGSKDSSHLKILVCGNSKKTYDLDKFRSLFGERMREDALYLGYYGHLVQDLLFRELVYDKYKWNPAIPGNVERLHKDYRLINHYVISKYGISNEIKIPKDFYDEAIHSLCPFEIEEFMEEMAEDFFATDEGDIYFFTEAMADEFVEKAVKICVKEYNNLYSGY